MTRLRSLLAPGVLALLTLPAAWPYFQAGLPRTNDQLTHFYRAVQLNALVGAGEWLPRWAPDLVFGYGYPVFNFFPFLSHLLVVGAHRLGLDFLTAFQAVCALVLLASAWTAYAYGREVFGTAAGVVTGVAYLYSPYLLYDAHIRGSLPESLALALLPLALLFLRRAARGHAPSVAWAGLVIGAMLFSHHGVSLQTLPFLGVYALFEFARMYWRGRDWRPRPLALGPGARRPAPLLVELALASLLPFLLGMLLAAFFWLPALTESAAVQIERGTTNGGMLYTENFLSLAELTAQPRAPVDPDLLNPPVVRALPLAAVLLAALAGMRAVVARRGRAELTFFALAAGLAVVLIHPVSRPLWDWVPLLRLTLFPWRLLGPAALFCAVGAGALFSRRDPPSPAPLSANSWPPKLEAGFLAVAVAGLVLAGLPFASPPYEAAPRQATLADMAAFEIPPDFIGTTTVGEYLPRGVQQLPADVNDRRAALARGEAVKRFTAPGAQVARTALGPLRDSFQVAAAQATVFTYRQFYFPGWRATLDGQPAALRVSAPDGLMLVEVPAGTHTLVFALEDTLPRSIGKALSLLGGLALAAWLWRARERRLAPRGAAPVERPWGAEAWPVLAGALALAVARPILWDAGYTPFLRRGLSADELRGVAHPLQESFADELLLLGWDVRRAGSGADDPLTLDLYWRAAHALGVPYGFNVQLVDAAGQVWSEAETPRPRDWRFSPGTDFWPLDQYVLEPYVLTPLAGTPPGHYQFRVEVFSRYSLQSLGTRLIGAVTITQPAQRACALTPLARFEAVELQSVSFSAGEAAPGDDVTVTVCWGLPDGQLPPAVQLQLLDAAGQAHLAAPLTLAPDAVAGAVGRYTLRTQTAAPLPADVPTGAYTWSLMTPAGRTALGPLRVNAPERSFTAPAVGAALDADLGPVALVRVDAPADLQRGQPWPVTLVWRADELMNDSYHVFVHLIGPDGGLVAQSDGVPADWTRRTPGWLPGEYVVDARTLALPADLPPGEYTLFAGLYRPGDGARLAVAAYPEGRVQVRTVTLP